MRKTVNLLALAIAGVGLCYSTAKAQLNLSWEEVGPNNQGNHVRAIAVDANGKVYAGSVGGGLWSSTDRGSSWSQVASFSANLAVSCIAVDGNKIFVGTGENLFYEPPSAYISPWAPDSVTNFRNGFFGYTGLPGQGVFVSTDGGATFSNNNGTWGVGATLYDGRFKSIQRVAINGNRTFVASLEGLWYSDNNLTTVTKATGTANFMSKPIVDVEVASGNVILASTRDQLFRSTDNGNTWIGPINDSLFSGGVPPNNRVGGFGIEIAVAPSNKSYVYVTGASDINGNCTGVWKSTDAGLNWARLSPWESASFNPFQGGGKYSMSLAVHPTDPDAVVLGGRRMWKYSSTTGWVTTSSSTFFPGFTTNFVPSPQLIIVPDPTSDSSYYVGTDAEIVRTENFGRTFSTKTKGLNAAQLHAVDGSVSFEVLASDRLKGLLYKDNSNSGANVQQFVDINPRSEGGIGRFSPFKLNHIISQGPDGGLERSFDGGTSFEPFYGVPVEPFNASIASQDSLYIDRADTSSAGGTLYDVGGTPVTPWCYDAYIPANRLSHDSLITETPAYLYMCSKSFVWLITNPYGGIDSLPRWNRLTNDLSRGNTGGGRKEFFTSIACANDQTHNVWVGTTHGRIYRIFHANDPSNVDVNIDVVRVNDASMPNLWVTDIAVHPDNSNIVAVTFGSYKTGEARVWITNNANDTIPTWRSAQGNLPLDLPVYSAAFSAKDPTDRVFLLGTERGVWASTINYTNTGTAFSYSNVSGPIGNALVSDIVFRRYNINWIDQNDYFYDNDNTILVATYGRGVFKSRSLVGKPEPTVVGNGIEFMLSPNPATTFSTVTLDLPSPTSVKLEVFDLQGHRVAQLSDKKWSAGIAEIGFNTSELPAGIYIIKGIFTNATGSYQHSMRQVVVK